MSTPDPFNEPDRVRIVLVGCGKDKREGTHEARDLYTGNLFVARRQYAEATAAAWYIVSAKHGLVAPTEPVESYNLSLDRLDKATRQAWGVKVLKVLAELHGAPLALEIHAGAHYAKAIMAAAAQLGHPCTWPVEHLGVGQQLAWYKGKVTPRAPHVYVGHFANEEWYTVTVDGQPFNHVPSLSVRNHSPSGFAWGYHGSGPAQLALAILLNETSRPIAEKHAQRFKRDVVATFPKSGFTLTSEAVHAYLEAAEATPH